MIVIIFLDIVAVLLEQVKNIIGDRRAERSVGELTSYCDKRCLRLSQIMKGNFAIDSEVSCNSSDNSYIRL